MKNKGFTLIELLAVIVILAIIALIAVPIVINIINDAKVSSEEESIKLYAKAIENAIVNYYMKHPEKSSVSYKDLLEENLINYSGTKIECDYIHIYDNKKLYLSKCSKNEHKVDFEYARPMKNMLIDESKKVSPTPATAPNYTFLNTKIKSDKIEIFNINTNGIEIPNGYDSIDCSYNQDKSVMCYWKQIEADPGYYEMNVAANGEIYTPYDSFHLFYRLGYEKLKALNLEGLNTKYSILMNSMFFDTGCSELETLNLGDKFDTKNVISMRHMFHATGYEKLEVLNLGNNFDTSNVKDMYGMFSETGHEKMHTLILGNKFDTSNVENMCAMFNAVGRISLDSLDLGDKFDTSNVKDMSGMFQAAGQYSMTTLKLGSKFTIPEGINIKKIFYGCGSKNILTSVIVPNQELKTKILGLEIGDIPSFWNDTIVKVQ